ncbi:glycosyltransferase [Bradyrhizobium sp. MOS002]|uniref:glycosyltransferase n=1 Tax=Bradyrhizobium sp. MOS002 TaxID=2133947 RepID=UPI001304EEF6|nr:glycosyltransferase [Bradyrhizobium sp. MOS002]
MKIAHVISGLSPESGGPTVAVLEIARWQCLLGNDCTILTGKGTGLGPDAPLYRTGAALRDFSTSGPGKFRYLPDFQGYLQESGRNFDLFVLHGSYQYATYAAAKFCRKEGIPTIFTPHGSLDPAVRAKHKFRNVLVDVVYHDRVIRNASAWHFTSEQERLACERKIWRESFVEPLAVDTDSIPIGSPTGRFRARYKIDADATVLLFLSRITRKKGIDILLDSFRRLAGQSDHIFLALCGPIDDDMKSEVHAAADDPNLKRKMAVTGHLMGQEKDDAFFDSNFFVLPTYSENFGIAAFEALAYGLPLITTTGMNFHAQLAQSGRAMIVEPTKDSFYRGLADALSGRWTPSTRIQETRDWLGVNFSWRSRADSLTKQYQDVVNGSRGERCA